MDPLPLGRCADRHVSFFDKRCDRWAILICSHCSRNLCHEHHQQHQNQLQMRTDQISNQINDLRLKLHCLSEKNFLDSIQKRIDEWFEKSKNQIELQHAQLSVHLVELVEKIPIDEFRLKQLHLIEFSVGQPLTSLLYSPNEFMQSKQFQQIEEKLKEIEQSVKKFSSIIQITDEGTLQMDRSMLHRKSSIIHSVDSLFSCLLHKFSLRDCPGPIAGSSPNSDYVLIFQSKPDFSLILFQDNQYKSHTSIDHYVNDICWSSITEVFLIVTESFIYEYSPKSNCLSSGFTVNSNYGILWSIACDRSDLYVSQKSDITIYQRGITPSFPRKQEWSKNELLEKTDRTIGFIRIDQEKHILAISVEQIDNRWRIDLFDIDLMQRLYRGSSLGLPYEPDRASCSFIPLRNVPHHWLVQYQTSTNCQIILLDQFGQIIDDLDRFAISFSLVNSDKIVLLGPKGIEIYRR